MSSKTVCSKTLRTRAKFAGVALALSSAWLFWTSPASAVMTIVDSEVFRVVLDPRDSNTLYAGTSNGVFKSTDQAESWYAINSGLPRSARAQAVTVDPQDSQTIYVGLDFPGGIFKSANGGDVWEPTGQTGGLDNVLDIVIDSNDPNRVHVAGSGFYSYVRSTDGGRDWSSGRYFATARAMAMDPLDSNTIYLALRVPFPPFGGVAKTIDGGDEWTRPESGLPRLFAYAVAIDSRDSKTVYLGFENGGIYKTTSGGKVWFPTGLPRNLSARSLAIDPYDSNTLYAGTSSLNRALFKTTDGGESWYPANEGIGRRATLSLAIDPVDPNILYAGTESGVFKSTDGAKSWSLTGQYGVRYHER